MRLDRQPASPAASIRWADAGADAPPGLMMVIELTVLFGFLHVSSINCHPLKTGASTSTSTDNMCDFRVMSPCKGQDPEQIDAQHVFVFHVFFLTHAGFIQ